MSVWSISRHLCRRPCRPYPASLQSAVCFGQGPSPGRFVQSSSGCRSAAVRPLLAISITVVVQHRQVRSPPFRRHSAIGTTLRSLSSLSQPFCALQLLSGQFGRSDFCPANLATPTASSRCRRLSVVSWLSSLSSALFGPSGHVFSAASDGCSSGHHRSPCLMLLSLFFLVVSQTTPPHTCTLL